LQFVFQYAIVLLCEFPWVKFYPFAVLSAGMKRYWPGKLFPYEDGLLPQKNVPFKERVNHFDKVYCAGRKTPVWRS